MTSDSEYDPRYLQGIEYFNVCDFFEAHEIWEEIWQETQGHDRKFLQGLIQMAVCLHHFGNGNLRGAVKLYHGCRSYLLPYAPLHMGVDLVKLLDDLQRCCEPILVEGEAPSTLEIEPDLIPEIHLVASG
jgi:predicted metal-dependent hydrolase